MPPPPERPLRPVRHLPPDPTGPSSGLAAVAGGAVLAASLTDSTDAATLVAGITLTSGLFFLALAVFRMGWLSQFLSRAVVTGFLFGAAIDVVIGELPKLTGTDSEGSSSFQELWSWLSTLDQAHLTTVVVAVMALVVVFGLRWIAPQVPGALVLLVGGLVPRRACWTSRPGGSPSSETSREGCRRSRCPIPAC